MFRVAGVGTMVPMAKIVHSDAAPAESVHYTFAAGEFDISGKKAFTTKDPSLVAEAQVHPWLDVKIDEADLVIGSYVETVKPEDDPLSAVNSIANDPDEARKAEAAKAADFNPVALDAGEVQTQVVETGGVAETLAADETSKTSDKVEN